MKRRTAAENVEYVLDDRFVLQEASGSTASHPAYRRYHYAREPLEVGVPLTLDAVATAIVGPFAKTYKAVRWGLGLLSAAHGAGRLKKASEEKGTQRTADIVAGSAEVVAGALMFAPEVIEGVPKVIKEKGSAPGTKPVEAPQVGKSAPQSVGAAAANDPALATDESPTILYRSMKPDASGAPQGGPTARTLGVRPGAAGDIPVEGDIVKPDTGGMSVTPDDPMGLPS